MLSFKILVRIARKMIACIYKLYGQNLPQYDRHLSTIGLLPYADILMFWAASTTDVSECMHKNKRFNKCLFVGYKHNQLI